LYYDDYEDTVLKSVETSSGCDVVGTAAVAGVGVVGEDKDETSEYEQPVTARHVTGVQSVCTAGLGNCTYHQSSRTVIILSLMFLTALNIV